ncbi:MAG: Maf family protein [Isosphaeraceae bacterium]
MLASTSPYRRSLLERLGFPFRCVAPRCDEAALQRELSGLEPRRLAEALALAKAASLAEVEQGSVIIGCDQLVAFEGQVFGKPGTADRAVDQLAAMAGRTHELITAMAVIHEDAAFRHTDVTRLRMRPLGRDAIARHVESDRPLDCAGSYKLESRGIVLFDRIESDDHSAITGLPLMSLVTILQGLGFPIP